MKKLAARNKENCDNTQISEEIEGRITKKLSREFSRTESRILGALSRLDEFLLNPLLQGHSESAPDTSRNTLKISQGTNEDDSQVDLHPGARVSQSQTTQVFGPDDSYDTILAKIFEEQIGKGRKTQN